MKNKKFKESKISLNLDDEKIRIREANLLKLKKPNLLGMGKLDYLKFKK